MAGWIDSVYSDTTKYYVSNPCPKVNEKVTISIRMRNNREIQKVFLRYREFGLERLCLMEECEYARHVYSGGGWADVLLGCAETAACAGACDYGCVTGSGDDLWGPCDPVYSSSREEEKGGRRVMSELFTESAFAGVAVSLLAYMFGTLLKKKFKSALLNPLLISIVVTILVLIVSGVDYEVYSVGAKYLSWFLTPATVCLAIPLYEQLELLKKNFKAVMAGIATGVITSMTTIFVLALLMGLSHTEYVTLLPKSITTAIGMGVSEELGGYVTITVAVIVITGVLGNILAEPVCKLFRITEPIAKGVAIGSAAHAIGTAKAMEMGEIEGAMSSLSIAVAGLLTVAGASVYACFL